MRKYIALSICFIYWLNPHATAQSSAQAINGMNIKVQYGMAKPIGKNAFHDAYSKANRLGINVGYVLDQWYMDMNMGFSDFLEKDLSIYGYGKSRMFDIGFSAGYYIIDTRYYQLLTSLNIAQSYHRSQVSIDALRLGCEIENSIKIFSQIYLTITANYTRDNYKNIMAPKGFEQYFDKTSLLGGAIGLRFFIL